jgi:DNA replication protein DnaC
MSMPAEPSTATLVAPQILLSNHLKALKLPTFAREYEKVAKESAQDRADYPRFLLRLCELERIDRERRNVERRIRLARFPQTKSFDTFDFAAQTVLEQGAGPGTDPLRMDRQARELHCARAVRDWYMWLWG